MFKRIIGKLLALALILTFCAAEFTAQTRIRFKRGKTSATISGKIARSGGRRFAVRGAKGQTLSLKVSSPTGIVLVVTRATAPDTSQNYVLESDGDTYIDLINDGRATTFTLTVSIE